MLLQETKRGLYCPAGDFYIDPWRGANYAVVTHGHADHARWGSKHVLTSASGQQLVQARVGDKTHVEGIPFGEPVLRNGVKISLHPAGHILGSAQVRIEHKGEVVVVSGDYKTLPDKSCEAFEPVKCHTFITESTFGLPIYRWRPDNELFAEINDWWRSCAAEGKTAILLGYSLGKAQRLLAGLDPEIGPILVHGAVVQFLQPYREQGIVLPYTQYANKETAKEHKGSAIVIAPPSVQGTSWLKKFQPASLAFASGWMAVRGGRRRRGLDRGFVVSDHADWEGLLSAIKATGADHIGVTHGHGEVLVRWLQEQGKDAWKLGTPRPAEPPPDEVKT